MSDATIQKISMTKLARLKLIQRLNNKNKAPQRFIRLYNKPFGFAVFSCSKKNAPTTKQVPAIPTMAAIKLSRIYIPEQAEVVQNRLALSMGRTVLSSMRQLGCPRRQKRADTKTKRRILAAFCLFLFVRVII